MANPEWENYAKARLTEHYNRLNEGSLERLALLAEECAEVIQAVAKIQRHGWGNFLFSRPIANRNLLMDEIGDVQAILSMMFLNADVQREYIEDRKNRKLHNMLPYLHHQERSILYDAALEIFRESRKGQTSLLQRKLRVDYRMATLLMKELEMNGVIGAPRSDNQPREVLIGVKKA